MLIGRHPSLSVVVIPPNTTAVLQPLDQVIANMKAAYARKSFALVDAATDMQQEIAALEEKHVLALLLPPHPSPESDSDLDDPTSTNTPAPTLHLLQNPLVISVIQFWKL